FFSGTNTPGTEILALTASATGPLVMNRQIASDLMMRPAVEQFSSRAFTNIEDIIRVGEVEAEKHVA
ncbi:hypothetical protein ACT4UT_21680, partial [Bacillus sp. B-TM1]